VLILSLWIAGKTCTGKTSLLVAEFCQWLAKKSSFVQKKLELPRQLQIPEIASPAILVFAANNHNRRKLVDLLSAAIEGTYPVVCKTPVGFITDEVMLFFPLLFDRLNLKAQFPLRLRPETEQHFATQLWRNEPDWLNLCLIEKEYRLVRQTLDLLQLAGASGIPAEDIPFILQQGLLDRDENLSKRQGELLLTWRSWCLERGLLGYGLIYELYWRYLLPDDHYQTHLMRRYQAIFADDVDDYPAIARDLFELMLDRGAWGMFTYNPDGKIRLGLNADSEYLAGLATRCRVKELNLPQIPNLALDIADTAVELVTGMPYLVGLPNSIESIQTISRAELLRNTAETIIKAVKSGKIQPQEIAIIAPGLDEIARYTLMEILSAQGIAIEPLSEQRPLISSPIVRTLLTLTALVYPGLGREIDRDAIAEMLTILSQKSVENKLIPDIDPVRAGLLADYCYYVEIEQPALSPVESFARWDRLGHQATTAYQNIVEWIEQTKTQLDVLSPAMLLSQAIEHFLNNGIYLSSERLATLRELIETAQHFWEVDRRLRQNEPSVQTQAATVAQFIQLLRRGTITANPLPLRPFSLDRPTITISNIFQYRSLRSSHRWQFWLDVSSSFWEQGGAATLFAAPLFLKQWTGRTWMPEDDYIMDKQRLQRIIRDLLGRTTEKVFLCHSDLAVNGTEQMGALFPLVQASQQLSTNY
jgi:hypothetical protein